VCELISKSFKSLEDALDSFYMEKYDKAIVAFLVANKKRVENGNWLTEFNAKAGLTDSPFFRCKTGV